MTHIACIEICWPLVKAITHSGFILLLRVMPPIFFIMIPWLLDVNAIFNWLCLHLLCAAGQTVSAWIWCVRWSKDAFMLVICTCINMWPIHIYGHWPTLMITIRALDLRWQHWARPKKIQFCIDQILNWLGNKNSLGPLQYLTVLEARMEIIIIQSSLTPTPIRF